MTRRLSSAARRAELIDTGKRIFAAQAYDTISTDLLARQTGTSKGLLYHYFGSKRGFYLAVIRDAAAELLDATAFEHPEDAAVASISGFVEFIARQGTLFRAIVRGGVGSDAEMDAVIASVRTELVQRLAAAAAAGMHDSPAGADACDPIFAGRRDALQTAQLWGWIGFAEGLAIHWVEQRPFDTDTLTALLVDSFGRLLSTGSLDAHLPK